MKNALRPSLLMTLGLCLLVNVLNAQDAKSLNSVQRADVDLSQVNIQSGFVAAPDCLNAINYQKDGGATLSATTSAAKSAWLQCPAVPGEGKNAFTYFNLTALDKPLANPWAGVKEIARSASSKTGKPR